NVVPASFSLRQSSFIENKGQLADQFGKSMPEVLYTYNANGLRCYLTESGMNFIFSKSVNPANSSSDISDPITRRLRLRQSDTLILRRLDMRFAGANPHPRVEAIGMTNGYFNYYLANCSLWGVHGYSKIVYHDLYPNIDLTIYTTETSVKYDFIVHPGGDPNVIAMQYSGMDSMSTSADGKFRVFTPLGTMEEDAPYSYQLNQLAHNVLPQNVAREEVPSGFAISDGSLRFRIGSYDKSRDLVIDPVRRMWGTYFGGNTTDNAQSPVVDKGNNIIFCGTTTSNSAIATSGAVQTVFGGGHDAYLAKFTTDGALIWATYYGGSSDEFCGGVALDSSDNLILYGETHSASGIATVGSHQTVRGGNIDAFLAKFDNTGARQWATYFGGDGTEAVAGNRGVAVDHGGHIYITGSTSSTSNLATVGAMQTTLNGNAFDNFLARFNSTGSLLWATYYGGAMDEYGLCLAAENTDLNFYVGGYTASTTNISTTTGFQANYGGGNYDGFIAKFNSQFGAQIWASYCGGPGLDYVTGLCIDTAGQIYGCGYSSSASNISTPGTYQPNHAGPLNGWDAFIVKLNPAGQRQWATYYGGSNFDYFEDIIPNGKSLLLAGETVSPDGITTSDAYQPGQGGGGFSDGLLAKFDFNGAFQYGSYYGGPVTDYGSGCVFDRLDKMILTGQSSSTSGIASPGAFKTTGVGGTNADGYVVKFCVIPTPVLTIAKDTICKDGADTLWLVPKYDHTYWYDGSTPLPNLTDKYIYVLQSPQTPGLHSISVF
ncbi:MAG: hypothetical protein Q8919_15125, partial [Bacteroidota bacterium]|nr:hypothetical protein [Bacteroidota bacterium]